MLLSYFVWKLFFPISYGNDSLAVALFCSTVAPLGGFLASAVKRAFNKKDFSNLIAGHGGLVDRLDCQLITAPFVYLLLNAKEPADLFEQFSAFGNHETILTQ
jgi:phosphatidate cytidylyltransferase